MRTSLSVLMLVCLASVTIQQQSQNQRVLSQLALPPPSVIFSRLVQKGVDKLEEIQKQFSGTDVNTLSQRKFGVGISSLFKPLLLVVLAKIKLALLFGNPLVLLVLKKLLLHAVLGKLLLQIPVILLGGKALLLTNILAIKFALIAKGLIGFKASLTLLFLGGFLKSALGGSGLTTILGLAGSLLKLTGNGFKSEEDDEKPFNFPNFNLPVTTFGIPPSFAKPSFNSPPVPLSAATSYQSRATVPSTPATPSTTPISTGANLSGTNFGLGISGFGANGFGGSGLLTIRAKRDVQENNGERRGEIPSESLEDLKLEFEAVRTNGNAYLYMAAQFDEQSCGLRLLCEVYQKPQESLTQDEILLQNLLGYPLTPLNEEDKDTPKEAYHMAAQLGTSYQGQTNNQICARFYSTCPHNAQQMIHRFITEDVQTNETDPDNRPASHSKALQTSHNAPFYYPRQSNMSPIQLWKSLFKMHGYQQ